MTVNLVERKADDLLDRLVSIDLNLFVSLLAVVDCNSVKEAAERIGKSSSSVSQDLKKLEKQLGLPPLLVSKGRNGVMPTPRAIGLASNAKQALKNIDDAINMGGYFNHAESSRIFKIASTQCANLLVIPRLIDSCLTRAPNISIETTQITRFESNDRTFESLAVGELDLVLDNSYKEFPFLTSTLLISDRWVWVHSPKAKSHKLLNSDDSLHPIFILDSDPHIQHRKLGQSSTSLSGAMDVLLSVVNIRNSKACVPKLIADLYAPSFGLVLSEPIDNLPKFEVSMYTHKMMSTTPERQFIANIVADNFRNILTT